MNTPSVLVYLDDLIYNKRSTQRAVLRRNLIEELTILKAIPLENTDSAGCPTAIAIRYCKVSGSKRKVSFPEKRKEEK
ncbi:MAG: hypothetical protein ACI8PW_001355 [Methylophilaceae bacterium]